MLRGGAFCALLGVLQLTLKHLLNNSRHLLRRLAPTLSQLWEALYVYYLCMRKRTASLEMREEL